MELGGGAGEASQRIVKYTNNQAFGPAINWREV